MITSGGNLAVPNITHMVVGSTDKQHLQLCVERCLQLADARGLKTISLPAIGTGAGGILDVDSAQVTFQALQNVLGSCVNLRRVRIVLYRVIFRLAFLVENNLMEQQQNRGLVPSSPDEPPRKKTKTEDDGQPDPSKKDKLNSSVTGPSKAGVKRTINTLKQGIAEAFTSQKAKHQTISQLSREQASGLMKRAQARDVKLEIQSAVNCIVVYGEHSAVVVGEIWRRLNETSEQKRAVERAKLTSK